MIKYKKLIFVLAVALSLAQNIYGQSGYFIVEPKNRNGGIVERLIQHYDKNRFYLSCVLPSSACSVTSLRFIPGEIDSVKSLYLTYMPELIFVIIEKGFNVERIYVNNRAQIFVDITNKGFSIIRNGETKEIPPMIDVIKDTNWRKKHKYWVELIWLKKDIEVLNVKENLVILRKSNTILQSSSYITSEWKDHINQNNPQILEKTKNLNSSELSQKILNRIQRIRTKYGRIKRLFGESF